MTTSVPATVHETNETLPALSVVSIKPTAANEKFYNLKESLIAESRSTTAGDTTSSLNSHRHQNLSHKTLSLDRSLLIDRLQNFQVLTESEQAENTECKNNSNIKK